MIMWWPGAGCWGGDILWTCEEVGSVDWDVAGEGFFKNRLEITGEDCESKGATAGGDWKEDVSSWTIWETIDCDEGEEERWLEEQEDRHELWTEEKSTLGS